MGLILFLIIGRKIKTKELSCGIHWLNMSVVFPSWGSLLDLGRVHLSTNHCLCFSLCWEALSPKTSCLLSPFLVLKLLVPYHPRQITDAVPDCLGRWTSSICFHLPRHFPSSLLIALLHTSSVLLDLCDEWLFSSVKPQGGCKSPNPIPQEVSNAPEPYSLVYWLWDYWSTGLLSPKACSMNAFPTHLLSELAFCQMSLYGCPKYTWKDSGGKRDFQETSEEKGSGQQCACDH